MSLRALHDVPAPAKLNLFLHVVGRREDGYHLLQSLFVLVDWSDRLHFEWRDDGRIARHDLRHGAGLPADDLCVRAARALQTASHCVLGADIHLDKQLPSGAGLGGGSSDAASTLLALNHLWGLHWPRERLAAIGLTLGADVPFFVHGENAFVEGIGERITPLRVPVQSYVVVKPPVSIETRSIFSHPAVAALVAAQGGQRAPDILAGSLEGSGGVMPAPGNTAVDDLAGGFGRNDLQRAAEDRCPEVAEAARRLEQRFGNSRMTGSGSAVFARVDSTAANFELGSLPAGWVGRMCKGLDHHPLVAWAG